jgi:hypothetical protein
MMFGPGALICLYGLAHLDNTKEALQALGMTFLAYGAYTLGKATGKKDRRP